VCALVKAACLTELGGGLFAPSFRLQELAEFATAVRVVGSGRDRSAVGALGLTVLVHFEQDVTQALVGRQWRIRGVP